MEDMFWLNVTYTIDAEGRRCFQLSLNFGENIGPVSVNYAAVKVLV
jgi:hypothetical protein